MSAPLRVASLCHGRFELGPQLGEGAVGIVYDAFDRERGARVALKLLRSLEPELLISFKTEFRAAHDLGHPNLVELGELFEDEGQWFFTMELVRGVHFLRGKYDEARLRGSLLQLAQGLGAGRRTRLGLWRAGRALQPGAARRRLRQARPRPPRQRIRYLRRTLRRHQKHHQPSRPCASTHTRFPFPA